MGRRELVRPLHFLHKENFVLVDFFVHGQLASLSEGLRAAFIGAPEGLLPRVDIGVLLQILAQRELLKADNAHKLLRWLVGGQVSPERETSSKPFVTM